MTQQIPSGRELEILKILWELGPSSVRQVHQRMCPHGELAFNTIQTLLRIMDEKGLVTHRDKGHTFIYTPVHSRDREAARFLDHVFDGAMDQFVLSLLNSKKASPKELKQLEAIIADARQRKRRGKKKGG
jgi:predicted transcriptional regulator